MNLNAAQWLIPAVVMIALANLGERPDVRLSFPACGSEEDRGDRPCVTAPIRDSYVPPKYPRKARRARVEARVVLEIMVARDGSVVSVEVTESSSPEYGFEKAATRAVRRWRYKPAAIEGKPVEVYVTVVVDFKLR